MVETVKQLLANQFEAALCMLNACIARCPAETWGVQVDEVTFDQAAFHAIFYADHYLGQDEHDQQRQPFHRDNPDFFGDYEELEPRLQVAHYTPGSLMHYVDYCRSRAAEVIAAESAESLSARCGFERRDFSRAELYIYNIRHLQHHAAQLSEYLGGESAVPWVGSGWRDL